MARGVGWQEDKKTGGQAFNVIPIPQALVGISIVILKGLKIKERSDIDFILFRIYQCLF